MTTELWEETEAAFGPYANAVPLDDVIRRARRRQARTRAATAGAGIVVVLLAGVTLLGGGTGGVAYAGWTPAIQPADAGVLAEAALTCQGGTEEHQREPGALLLVDRRGEMTVGSYPDGTLCVVIEGRLSGVFGNIAEIPPSDGAVTVDHVHRLGVTDRPRIEITAVTGTVDEDVDAVSIRRADGVEVEAIVGDGAFLAWWPRSERPVEVRATAGGELRGTWSD